MNGLEQYASLILTAEAKHLVDSTEFDRLFGRTVDALISAVNQFYDLICWHRTLDPNLFTSLVELYQQWEPQQLCAARKSYERLPHLRAGPPGSWYVLHGSDEDFQDYPDHPNPTSPSSGTGQKVTVLVPTSGFLWVQIVDEALHGIPAWPLEVSMIGARRAGSLIAGCVAEESPRSPVIFTNSSGTVAFRVDPEIPGEGTPSVEFSIGPTAAPRHPSAGPHS